MSSKKTKLELTWIGKEHRPRLEPRILLEEPDKSHHAKFRVREPQILTTKSTENTKGKNAASASGTDHPGDIFDNMLIRGDNLLGLKALEQEFAGKVKCVFIDPPYNTGSAFEHYDDGVEHSIWLSLMRDRLELIKKLLTDDGSLWITIDDNEAHYLKVLCDEIFGRSNFISNGIWQKKFAPQNDAKLVDNNHDHLFIFAKNKPLTAFNLLPRTTEMNDRYKNPDNDPRGPWTSGDSLRKEYREYAFYEITTPAGRIVSPPPGSSWRFNKEEVPKLIADNRLWFGKDGKGVPRIKRFLSEVKDGVIPQSIWSHEDVGNTQEAKKETIALNKGDIFGTPKPERLIQRVLQIATNPGDLVLDSFLGSGTTAAVAHKMGRRWIGIELGGHCETHCLPRLKKVVDGEDPGGITQAVGWKGGGGFRYYRLAPSLLEKDKWDNWVVSKEYNAAMLAEAVCKLEGFSYEPSDSLYWQHGHSTERDFIYTTTANLSHDQLQELSDEVGPERSLLVVCSAFRGRKEGYVNLTVKKIPNAVLTRCEWGKDDYSLKVENLPKAPPPPGQQELF
jgi:adenine-specific DNA-methyltransferase